VIHQGRLRVIEPAPAPRVFTHEERAAYFRSSGTTVADQVAEAIGRPILDPVKAVAYAAALAGLAAGGAILGGLVMLLDAYDAWRARRTS
jgi:hypothetical protein